MLLGTAPIERFVDWLCEQESFEEAAYWIATAYASLVGDEVRTEKALYFTHPVLAERVIDDLLMQGASLESHHWHDPACGGAAFLVPVAMRMATVLRAKGCSPLETVQAISRNLSGNDTSSTLISFSKVFLRLALADVIKEAGVDLDVTITLADGLLDRSRGRRPDVVVCNPPYRKLKAQEAQQYAHAFDKALQGQPNLYALFIEQSLRRVKEGGLIGLLTPTSYLAGPTFSQLRKHLCHSSQVLSLDLLGNRNATFLNVEQETVIATLRASPPASGETPRQSPTVAVWAQTKFEKVGVVELRSDGGPWALPRSREDKSLLALAQGSPYRLRDYGYATRIGHHVPHRSQRPTHRDSASCEGRPVIPLVWATDISPEGLFQHGRPHRQRGPQPYIEVDAEAAAGVLTAPAVLLQRLTSTEQSRRLVAAALPKEFLKRNPAYVCENHVLALLQEQDSRWQPEEVAAIFQSQVADRLYRTISGSANVGTYELNELPLPNPDRLKQALAQGLDIENALKKAYQH